ncbi:MULTISPECIES: Rap1a/Tai family immunity protein [unclassified Xanthomonas]|uniref:Rap1a/Tai family immunity protein n=1 Tax=Xanthomonas sp. LMG 9002 TaxID=1591158 RepID=UPI00136F472B|nr:Rap1a/Tai family immunity protein [Xanthomonas sp. LMG 9002]
MSLSSSLPRLLCLCLAAGSAPAAASVAARPEAVHQLSAGDLLRLLRGDAQAVATPLVGSAEQRRAQASAMARLYIAGVADANVGTQWCAGEQGVLAHELVDRVFTALAALPPAQLRQRAAVPVEHALHAAFPCTAR